MATAAPGHVRTENGATAVAPRSLRTQSIKMRPVRRAFDVDAVNLSSSCSDIALHPLLDICVQIPVTTLNRMLVVLLPLVV